MTGTHVPCVNLTARPTTICVIPQIAAPSLDAFVSKRCRIRMKMVYAAALFLYSLAVSYVTNEPRHIPQLFHLLHFSDLNVILG
jgi:hypothetical protein